MQRLAEICIQRPVFAAMIVLALVVVGATGYTKLGVDRFPSVDLPTVSVRTSLPGAAPEEVEAEVSEKIEEAVNTVAGISELRSISGQSTSIVIATFDLDRDIESAAQDVRDRVSTVIRNLPEDTTPPVVSKFDNDSSPVITVALAGDKSVRELTEIADKRVKVLLERAPGVGEVSIVGGLDRAIDVWVDPEKLAAYALPIAAVRDALRAQNVDAPGGNVAAATREIPLRTMGRLEDPRQFEDLVVATIDGTPVRVRDIGRAEDATKEQRSLARLDGVPTVTLEIRRQSGANTMEVIEGVKSALEVARAQVPPDVRFEVIRDQSRYIEAALHEIDTHLVLGSILACLVVLAFMRSWRSVVIAGIAIPASVVSTFGMMWALNFTLNSVTMLALVLMVGIVIDDAIVVLENIFRFIEEKGLAPMDAAREATRDIGLAVLATTLSLVVIFVPVSFMSSVSGRFLYQFGITAAVAVLVSLLVSFTLTPMMSARLLRAEDHTPGHGDAHGAHADVPADGSRGDSRSGFYGRIDRLYAGALAIALRHRPFVAGVAIAVAASTFVLANFVRTEYIPSDVDEAEFDVGVTGPEGMSLDSMNQAMLAVENEIRTTPGVRTVLANAGGSFLGGVNQGNAYVRIAPHDERTLSFTKLWHSLAAGRPLDAFRGNYAQRDVMQEIRKRMRKYSHLRVSVRNAPSFNIGGGNADIDFAVRGPDVAKLAEYANALRAKVTPPPGGGEPEIPGIVDADVTLKLDKPELHVAINRDRAADLGVRTDDISTALRLMVGGDDQVTRFRDETTNEDYDVGLRLENGARNDPDAIRRLTVPSAGGGLVRLDDLVSLEESIAPSRIDRTDRQRQVSMRAGVAPGYALSDRLDALRAAADSLGMEPGYTIAIGGKGKELARTRDEFIFAFMLSIVFMYMILASQFESLIHPVTILLSLPLAIPFAILGQLAVGGTMNLYSALGILVLFGVVKKNAILQIDHMNALRAEGLPRAEAVMRGNRDRLRPILMTTLTLVAGMMPLALGTGPGAEERRSVAVVVIVGQTLSLGLTLIVTPVAYTIFDDLAATRPFRAVSAAAAAVRARLRRPRPAADDEVAGPPPSAPPAEPEAGD